METNALKVNTAKKNKLRMFASKWTGYRRKVNDYTVFVKRGMIIT